MLKIGMIGCGRPRGAQGATGFGMAHWHAQGYKQSGQAEFIALSDISEENARAFADEHGGERIYADYNEMLQNEALDMVSIATWPHLHAPMVLAAAQSGVRAIHCEKPVATSWADAQKMVEVCRDKGVQLTFNHQRRFNEPFRRARELVRDGEIGELLRIEAKCGDLFDWGTHWFDMMFFYNAETPADWVLAAVDWRGGQKIFGVPLEGQALCQVKFHNDVRGLLVSGYQNRLEASNRLVGTQGTIEVDGAQTLRMWNRGHEDWREIPVSQGIHAVETAIPDGIADAIEALQSGREPELSAAKALRASELIFACYESARRGERVDLPLESAVSPFEK